MRKVIILDTSILCVWLKVPGMETCGPDNSRWTFSSVKQKIDSEIQNGATLVLPFASIVETGNHITHARGDKHEVIKTFVEYIENALDGEVPWVAFTEQSHLIGNDEFRKTLRVWKETALSGQSLGDAMIVEVAKYYAAYNIEVEIFTGDEGLKAYEPLPQSRFIPRRRR